MVLDLPKALSWVKPDDIFNSVREHATELLLPDQNILNYLYGALWNYDARYFSDYLLRSKGTYTMGWVLRNTGILHFCGKKKP